LRFVILHYHILKNAGTTIEEGLDRSFGHRLARLDQAQRDATIGAAELLSFVEARPQLAAVTSHQIRYPLPEAPGLMFFDICFLRDPIDRVRSLYDYYRDKPDPGDPVSDVANTSDLGGFVRGMVREQALQVRNVQVNLIAAAGDSDEPTRADLELAVHRMTASSMPGAVDLFRESVRAGQYFLQQVFPELEFETGPVNVSGGLEGNLESRAQRIRAVCDPDDFSELMAINQLDLELLARVREEVRRRAALVPSEPKLVREALANPVFDAEFYLRKYPDVAAARVDPLRHYLKYGRGEGRKPHRLCEPGGWHPLFDPDSGRGRFEGSLTGALAVNDARLDPENPEPQQRRFVQAANRDQLCAQTLFQKAP